MKTKFLTLLATASLALLAGGNAWAQDVTFNLQSPDTLSGDKASSTANGCTVNYVMGINNTGAYIYSNWSIYSINFTADKKIAVIELDGYNNSGTADVTSNIGNLHMHPGETSVWQGSNKSVTFTGSSSTANYNFTKARVWYVGTPYGKQYAADPTVGTDYGNIAFKSATNNATFHYTMQLTADSKTRMTTGEEDINMPIKVKVYTTAQGMENSSTIEQNIPFSNICGTKGDANGDGKLNTSDILELISNLFNSQAK